MIQETQEIIHRDLNFLPLKSYANIFEGNALTLDWQKICPNPNFIFGNPPFVGASMMNSEQKQDAVKIFGKIKLSNSIDYVGAWYHKAAQLMQGTTIKAAFVSTNSITQGEQVAPLWKPILFKYTMQLIFAYKTFKWDSESSDKAAVHCVIIGMADKHISVVKKIFDGEKVLIAENINPYLFDAPDVLVESRSKPLCDVPKTTNGNKPTDDGNFIFSEQEAEEFAKKYPSTKNFYAGMLARKIFCTTSRLDFVFGLKMFHRMNIQTIAKLCVALTILKFFVKRVPLRRQENLLKLLINFFQLRRLMKIILQFLAQVRNAENICQ